MDTGSTNVVDCSYTGSGNGPEIVGLIGAELNDKLGVGVAPGALIYDINLGSEMDTIVGWTKALQKVNDYCDPDKVDVVVMDAMYTFPLGTQTEINKLQGYIDALRDQGTVVLAPMSLGNVAQTNTWPASCDHVISVGATGYNNLRLGSAGYYSGLDIAAPGEMITTLTSSGYKTINNYSTICATAIAAGEVALIMQNKADISALHQQNKMELPVLTGADFVDALEKHIKASTIAAGAGTGKGIVYLPKALGLGTITTVPSAPIIIINEETPLYVAEDPSGSGNYVMKYDFSISDKSYDVDKYYFTLNGKNPSYKNGVADKNSSVYYPGTGSITVPVDITQKQFTIKAIAVNKLGAVSAVSTHTVPLNYVYRLEAFAPDGGKEAKLTEGRKMTFTSKMLPNNAVTKGVTWHIGKDGVNPENENDAKNEGVTISASGQVTAKKGCSPGNYYVWAVAKKSGTLSDSVTLTVASSYFPVAQRIKPVQSNIKLYRKTFGEYYKIMDNISADGNFNEASMKCVSSNVNVAKVGLTSLGGTNHWAAELTGPGKATITCYTTDGSSLKTSFTIEVLQKATKIEVTGNSQTTTYLSRGKSLTLNYELDSPSYTPTPTKITKWTITDDLGNPITDGSVKISNKGVVSTTNAAILVEYRAYAEITYPDGTTVNNESNPCLIRLLPGYATNLKVDTVKSQNKVYRVNTAFTASGTDDTEGLLYFKTTGVGFQDGDLFEVTSSNENILTVDKHPSYDAYLGEHRVFFKAKGNGTGTATITVRALAGNKAKCTYKVTVENPASSIKIGPAKAGQFLAVAPGKKLNLKAVLGEEYGKLSSNGKKVKWEILGSCPFASINASTGALSIKKDAANYISGRNKTFVTVKATSASGAVATTNVAVFKDFGKIQMCDSTGGKPPKSYTMANNYNMSGSQKMSVYVKIPKDSIGMYYTPAEDDIIISSSNPSVAQVSCIVYGIGPEGQIYDCPEFCVYEYEVICTMPYNTNKAGNAKITIGTIDGAKSVSFTVKVSKR